MKRTLWFLLLASILLVAGCSKEKTEQTPITEEDELEVEEEVQDEEGQDEEGTNQNIGAENKPPIFNMDDDNLVVYGLTLGDSPSDAQAIWGDPEILEEEPMGDADTYHYYPALGMTVGYFDEKLTFIAVDADDEDLNEISSKFKGDHYRNPEGDADYFFSPENGQLLIYGTVNSVDGDTELRLLMSDDNFFYYVDEGIYEKVEEAP